MNERTRHRQLYRQVPCFQCRRGCSDCCSPAPVSPYEAERLGIAGQTVTPTKPGSLSCLFSTAQGCQVYEKRPLVCRLFGTVDTPLLTCPHGCQPNKRLTEQKGQQLITEYIKMVNISP